MADTPFERYKERVASIVRETLDDLECQPIFFIGTGLSKRYIGAPTWMELLEAVAGDVNTPAAEFAYLRQKANNDPIEIGSRLEEITFEWAWKTRSNLFPAEMFSDGVHRSSFFKFLVCKKLQEISPHRDDIPKLELSEEIELLRKTNPRAIITTNYDNFIENVFSDFSAVVGEKVIRRDMNLIGEVFKIHGSMEEYNSLVITSDDYDNYRTKKKYISSKLLTYFAEHPVFIFGYGLGDANVNGIIEDVAEIIGGEDRLIDNIFYVEWRADAYKLSDFREEYVIGSGEKQFRVKSIVTDSFDWIYRAIAEDRPLEWVNPKMLRALQSRFYKLMRSDLPKRDVKIDYEQLSSIADSEEALPKLLGIGVSNSPNASHPLNITQVGKMMGHATWHKPREYLKRIKDETGIDLAASDNKYHYAVPYGSGKSCFRRWSKDVVPLLEAVRDGKKYTVEL